MSEITRDPEKTKVLRMLDAGPNVVLILKSYFVLEKKAALLWSDVVRKVEESHPAHLSHGMYVCTCVCVCGCMQIHVATGGRVCTCVCLCS